ncbi:MAG: MBL fold metallo-hydrolase, partial [Oscillospiraceae bacterium]|nr:MBL fold metallo-hydrolase [Oscillospiraceae bacterium]
MKITWLGHACWRIEDGGYSVVIDPFSPGSVPGYPDVSAAADAVYCSHDHGDHNCKAAVSIVDSGAYPFEVKTVPSWHDDKGGTLRGYNIIHIFDAGFMRVVHLGDLGHTLSDEQLSAIGTPDVLMIPVGGFYTIDAQTAKQTADRIGAR